ncbi:mago nashi protein (macronuclear) [Tetrahymena thermophila SB210]|uniref:Mago nashi protein n=1 Tax=Tetrahymena thermophila (strain SB210) TaxID=312017 RepID=I7M1L6_TETTS|nr:mago nashi protein [Tetrahymena thermophila SB210]EAR97132.3 mago nashi protein [Tetrahymena thermophila SB210]|eukprot:XP_001017377.3 mago nashi protein [Tetrahymena thermophila SB210]
MTEMNELDTIFRILFCTIQILFLKYIYYRHQRQGFMKYMREKLQYELIDQIIPMQLFVINYNPITQRIELVDSNIRAKQVNQISSDDKLDIFMQSAQLNFTEKQKKKIITLKHFLLEMFIKLDNKKQTFQEIFKNSKEFNKIIAYQVNKDGGNTVGKYKIKLFPRGKKNNQIVVALEDLSQIEELKLVKQKAKQADQHLQIFFEYFKQKFARIFHTIDISCSMKIEDPMVELMQAKRITTKLYSTVQNIAAFRKQDNDEQGTYNAQRFSKRVRMKSLNPSSVSQFNFNNLIDDVKNIYPDFFNSYSYETHSNSSSQNQIQIYSDNEKMKSIFITLLNQIEECLPEKYFKGLKVSFTEEKETHFEFIKVKIQFQVHNDCVQNTQLKDASFFQLEKENKKIDSYEILKQLLCYYNSDNDEIRDIEIAMIKFYLSQISPYEMEIKEEAIEQEFQRLLSNSLIGNMQKDHNQISELDSIKNTTQNQEFHYYQMPSNRQVDGIETTPQSFISTNRQNEFENDLLSQELVRNTNKKLNQDTFISENENNKNQIQYISNNIQHNISNTIEGKVDVELTKRQSFKRVNQKKLSQFHRQTKQHSIDYKEHKNIILSMTFFKDIRVILELNLRQNSQASNNNNNNNNNTNNNQNYLDLKSRQNSTYSYNKGNTNFNQTDMNLLPTMQFIPKQSILKKNSMQSNQSPMSSPTQIKRLLKNNSLVSNINIFNNPNKIRSNTSIDDTGESKQQKLIPFFEIHTLKKLQQQNEKINKIKQNLTNVTIQLKQKDNISDL